jgi:hypothetical protein
MDFRRPPVSSMSGSELLDSRILDSDDYMTCSKAEPHHTIFYQYGGCMQLQWQQTFTRLFLQEWQPLLVFLWGRFVYPTLLQTAKAGIVAISSQFRRKTGAVFSTQRSEQVSSTGCSGFHCIVYQMKKIVKDLLWCFDPKSAWRVIRVYLSVCLKAQDFTWVFMPWCLTVSSGSFAVANFLLLLIFYSSALQSKRWTKCNSINDINIVSTVTWERQRCWPSSVHAEVARTPLSSSFRMSSSFPKTLQSHIWLFAPPALDPYQLFVISFERRAQGRGRLIINGTPGEHGSMLLYFTHIHSHHRYLQYFTCEPI